MKKLFLLITHGLMLFIGFAAGIYVLPILVQPESPDVQKMGALATKALFTSPVTKDLVDSDALHYGEGILYVGEKAIAFNGKLSPGPDYKLYLSPIFVETEAAFIKHKADMVQVGDIRTFSNFMVSLPEGVNPSDYSTAIVWCEAFGQFITATQYQN